MINNGRYKIQKLENTDWVDVPFKEGYVFDADCIVLEPHRTYNGAISLDHLSEYNKNDEYRIVKEIDGNEYYCTFCSEENLSVNQ